MLCFVSMYLPESTSYHAVNMLSFILCIFLLLSKHLFSITLIIMFTYIYIIHQPVQQHEEHLPIKIAHYI